MSRDLTELRHRVESFQLDDPESSLPFTDRLARDNGWSHDYAERVVREYKRFAFMAVAGDRPVTPSDAVDQVWHLHLCYTRSYWEQFCGNVLQKPLHHEPTRGGKREQTKHEDQYARTLQFYRESFGEEPPTDIWPRLEDCFRSAARMVRVNRDDVWLLPKPRLRRPTLLMLLLSTMTVGCTPMLIGERIWAELRVPWVLFIEVLAAAYGASWIATWFLLRSAKVPRKGLSLPDGFADDPNYMYERAYLAGGAARVVDTVLIELIQKQKLDFDFRTGAFGIRVPASEFGSGFEGKAMAVVAAERYVRPVRGALFELAEPFRQPLDRYGLLVDPEAVDRVRHRSMTLFGILILATMGQIASEALHGATFKFRYVFILIGLGVTLGSLNWRVWRNRNGDRIVEELARRSASLKEVPKRTQLAGFPLAVTVSLFGVSVLQGTYYEAIGESIAPATSSSGSGCGSDGCGSGGDGGCGGGCG